MKTEMKIRSSLGNNETPLKYTGGMVLAVPVDAELFNLTDELVILSETFEFFSCFNNL